MMRWARVASGINPKRYELLSDFLADQGIKNKWTYLEMSPSSFQTDFHKVKNDFDQLRIDSPFRHESFITTNKHHAEMLMLRSADTFFQDPRGSWWLRSSIFYAMEALINKMTYPLVYEGEALIVGVGGAARAAISALVKAGMRKFNITNVDDDEIIELIEDLKRIYFNIEFNFVSQSQLVLLSGTNSVVVNTTPYSASNEIVKELSYFNFLKSPGLIWELSTNPIETELVTEAMQIGANVIRGHEFATESDRKWIQWVWPDQAEYLDFKSLEKSLLRHGIFVEAKTETETTTRSVD